MANTPKKMKDPTEAALSAIQDALTVRDTTPEPVSPPAATQRDEPASEPPWRTLRSPTPTRQDMYDDDVHPDDIQHHRPSVGSSRRRHKSFGLPRLLRHRSGNISPVL